MTHTIFVK